jgi:hypothetical protein
LILLALLATALPPDVRRGYAPPVILKPLWGYALGSGSALFTAIKKVSSFFAQF